MSTEDNKEDRGENQRHELPRPEAAGEPGTEAAEQQFYRDGEQAGQLPDEEPDPELMQLPRARRRRHPLISFAVIALSGYLMWFLRDDIAFFLQPRAPRELGDVTEALQQGRLQANTFVRLSGAPDRKHAVILEARFGGYESFFRLLQTENRVFVQQHRELRNTDEVVSGTHQGQLVPFASLPYAETMASYFARTMTVPHDFGFAEVKRAKAAAGPHATVKDHTGAVVELEPQSQIWINAAFSEERVVQFSKAFYPTAEAAAERLAELGLPAAPDPEKANTWWRFVVWAEPRQLPQLFERVKDPELHANVVQRQVSYLVSWRELQVQGQTLVLDGSAPGTSVRFQLQPQADGSAPASLVPVRERTVRIPQDAILFITASSPLKIADDAFVLLADKAPDDHWYYALLYLVLGVFIALNGLALLQRLRARRALAPR